MATDLSNSVKTMLRIEWQGLYFLGNRSHDCAHFTHITCMQQTMSFVHNWSRVGKGHQYYISYIVALWCTCTCKAHKACAL